MRVLIIHNRYRQGGGEDQVVLSESRLLRDRGVEELTVDFSNDVVSDSRLAGMVRIGWASNWSKESYRKIALICRQFHPDVAHVHNFWMRLSPSVHAACHAAGVATVQTLHNFRLLCLNAVFLREGKPCEGCLGKVPWRGVAHRCYRGSLVASAAVARMIAANRRRRTWERDVDAFIALSEHSRSKFIAGRLPADRIFVKRNFVEDPGPATFPPSASDQVLYAGRLSAEKNLAALLLAWSVAGLSDRGRLLIVGEGPERAALEKQAADSGLRVAFTGWKDPAELRCLAGAVRAVVLPSISENCPRAVLEAFSYGRPVVASDAGALSELVGHGRTGLTCNATDPAALGQALRLILTDDRLADRLGRNARSDYLTRFVPQRNYQELLEIYRFAIEHFRSSRSSIGTEETNAPFSLSA